MRIGVWACGRVGVAAENALCEWEHHAKRMIRNISIGSICCFEVTDGLARSYAETPTRLYADTLP